MAVVGLLVAAAGALAGVAVVRELAKPADQRTWHGEVAGVPYDFRPPTVEKIQRSFWDPENPRLLTRHAFGVGWGVNLARLAELSEPATVPPEEPALAAEAALAAETGMEPEPEAAAQPEPETAEVEGPEAPSPPREEPESP